MKNTPPQPKTILLVDDRDDSRVTTKWFLSNFGYTVDSVRNAEDGLARFDPKVHDIVVTDNTMPGMSGAEMAHVIKMRSPNTPILMYTGLAPEGESSVDMIILKPAHILTVKEGVDQLIAKRPSPGPAGR